MRRDIVQRWLETWEISSLSQRAIRYGVRAPRSSILALLAILSLNCMSSLDLPAWPASPRLYMLLDLGPDGWCTKGCCSPCCARDLELVAGSGQRHRDHASLLAPPLIYRFLIFHPSLLTLSHTHTSLARLQHRLHCVQTRSRPSFLDLQPTHKPRLICQSPRNTRINNHPTGLGPCLNSPPHPITAATR